jgi:hypothetical protein
MGYVEVCSTGGANTHAPKCQGNYGRDIFPIIVPATFSIATEATAMTAAAWTAPIKAALTSRIYPFPKFFKFVPSQAEYVYAQSDFGDQSPVRPGYPSGIAHYQNLSPCFRRKLAAFNDQDWRVYWVTEFGFIRGKSTNGTLFEPFKLFYNVENDMPAVGDEPRMTPIRIFNKDVTEWNEYGAVIKPTAFDARDLAGLLDVTVAVFSSAAALVVVDVQASCSDTPIAGLVVGDFVVYNSALAAQPLTSATESSTIPGRYSLVITTPLGAGTYTVNLKTPAAMTTLGYESEAAISFIIPA